MVRFLQRGYAFLLVAGLAGCGSPSPRLTVTGTVAYQDVPVEAGFITFAPVHGHGFTRGGEIVDGEYTVSNLLAGKYQVVIRARPVAVIDPAGKGEEAFPKLVPSAQPIPANAAGNQSVVDVTPDSATFHFELRPPPTP